MKRIPFILILAVIFFYTAIAFIGSGVTFPLITSANRVLNFRFYDYAGITHVHTNLSTGSGTLDKITKAAARARCSFVIITDLNVTQKPENAEGYRNDVLLIWGGEYSYLGGHLLTYNFSDAEPFRGLGQTQVFFNDILHQKARSHKEGFLVAAHPFLPQHSWEDLLLPGLTGFEVLNLDSIWRGAISQNKLGILWSFLILPFNPDLSYLRLYEEPRRELSIWDSILQKRSFVGFSGSDATANAIPYPKKSFDFPSYAQSFRLTQNHILSKSELTGSFSEDRQKVLESLAHGHFYLSVDIIGDPAGFYFIGEQGKQDYLLGSTLSLKHGPIRLTADLGREINLPHEILLFRNGVKIAASNTDRLQFDVTQPGAYRTTVRVIPTLPVPDGKTWLTWIFSNAIRVEP